MLAIYLKKYFWTFQLLVIGICAYLSASTANNLLAASIDPHVEKGPSKSVVKAKKLGVIGGDDGKFERNPFCSPTDPSCSPPVPVEQKLVQPDDDQEGEQQEDGAGATVQGKCPPRSELVRFARQMVEYAAKKKLEGNSEQDLDSRLEPPHLPGVEASPMNVKLLATVVASSPELSLATFEENGEIRFYRGKDDSLLMGEARVEDVLREFVFVVRAGKCEYIALSGKGKRAGPTRLSSAGSRSDIPLGKGIKKVGRYEYLIDRDEIENTLANLNKVATDARIVPSFKNGKGNGFKLFSIRPGSIYNRIGIQNGDVVQKINGYPLDSPEKALEVYQKLQDADHVTIDLLRRGKNITMEYTIR